MCPEVISGTSFYGQEVTKAIQMNVQCEWTGMSSHIHIFFYEECIHYDRKYIQMWKLFPSWVYLLINTAGIQPQLYVKQTLIPSNYSNM